MSDTGAGSGGPAHPVPNTGGKRGQKRQFARGADEFLVAKRRPGWDLQGVDAGLRLSPWPEGMGAGRRVCGTCGRKGVSWCYACLTPNLPGFPRLALPFHFDILLPENEERKRNTGPHAAVLAPDHAAVLSGFRHLHETAARERTAVLFPAEGALLPWEVETTGPRAVERVLVLDSRWKAARGEVARLSREGVTFVKLAPGTRTSFWRFHTDGVADEGCSTIEAIRYFLQQRCEGLGAAGRHPEGGACHCYDDLLWLFAEQHAKVARTVAERKARRHRKGGEGSGGLAGEAEGGGEAEAEAGGAGLERRG